MKIAQVVRRYWPHVGGVETCVAQLAAFLTQSGHSVEVITVNVGRPGGKSHSPALGDEWPPGVAIKRLRGIGTDRYRFVPGLVRAIKDADIVHVHNVGYLSEYLGCAKSAHGKPLVLTTHGGFYHGHRMHAVRTLRRSTVTRLSLRGFDHIFCTSRADCERFGILGKRYSRSPNTVVLPDHPPSSAERSSGLMVYVGRLARSKRIDLLLDALQAMVGHNDVSSPKVRCLIVGPPGDDSERLYRLADALNRASPGTVRFLGEIDSAHLERLRRRTDVFVSPSGFESFGVSVLEALSFGNVVVASDIEAHQELIDHGSNGFLANFHDRDSVSELLRQVSRMPESRKTLIRRAALATAKRYGPEQVFGHIEGVYHPLRAAR